MSVFPIDRVRREFPALSQSCNGRPRIFMDNPAGTQLPRAVIDAISNALVEAASNYGGFFANSRNAEATHDRKLPAQVAERLARDEICVWSGHNYAFEVVKHLGIDEETGVVRIGLAHYNTEEEVDKTLIALEGALK